MSVLGYLALFGWVPVCLVLFMVFPPRRAVIIAFVASWLFLPEYGVRLSGLPDYTKMAAAVFGTLLGCLLFDFGRFERFRLRVYDLPMLVFAISPILTSLLNGLGLYDGISSAFSVWMTFVLPYFIGRMYFSDLEGLRELAIGIFIGGVVYVPLCLWEIRMSPQLSVELYGIRPSHIMKAVRYGGYRPLVFLWTYLPVVFWMTAATLSGIWLWKSKAIRSLLGFPLPPILLAMLVTLTLCKTFLALVLLPLGLGILWIGTQLRTSLPVVALVLFVPVFMLVRGSGAWDGAELYELVEGIDQERAFSLQYRIENENRLAEKARQRLFFGWGGWDRSRIHDEETGEDLTTSDGFWIIHFGSQGLIALGCYVMTFVAALLRFFRRFPARVWHRREVAPAALIATLLCLNLINQIPNYTRAPVFMLALGGIMALRPRRVPLRPRVRIEEGSAVSGLVIDPGVG